MGTTAQKLQKIRESKEAIRMAIEAKGVDIPNTTPLSEYDNKIALIEADEWEPTSDWIQLEEPNDNEILLLASDINPHYAIYVKVNGGYMVDWGDCTVDSWTSEAIASHTYTVGAGEPCSRGYTTFKIRIYAQVATNQISTFQTVVNTNSKSGVSNGFLWAKFGTRYINVDRLFSNRYHPIVRSYYLESVELPENMVIDYKNFTDTCNFCLSLERFRMPKIVNQGVFEFDKSFYATKLRRIDISGIPSVAYFEGVFQNCVFLKEIIMPQSFSFASQTNSFYRVPCNEIVMPAINNTLNGLAFFYFFSGKKIVFNATYENKIVKIKSMFENCGYLEDLEFVNSVALIDGNIANFIGNNQMLKSFRFPDNTGVAITNSSGIFAENHSIETISNFPPMTSSTNISASFRNCHNLKNIDNLDNYGDTVTGMDTTETYANCFSLNPVGGLKVRNKIVTRFVLTGVSESRKANLQALLFTNPSAVSTWAGSSPQIDVNYCSMEADALNALFTSIIATSASFSGKTIRITGNPGANTCDTTIITNAGGTVNKTT